MYIINVNFADIIIVYDSLYEIYVNRKYVEKNEFIAFKECR